MCTYFAFLKFIQKATGSRIRISTKRIYKKKPHSSRYKSTIPIYFSVDLCVLRDFEEP